jgi:chromosome segregation protein
LTARLSHLRIAGFKSFAEPAMLEILPGLTGIIGPNGCGKSNIVDALRWAMGEASAKSLRGGEMDDVIFAGTATRPARNLAEVTLGLADAAGTAPPPFQGEDSLEVSRRIERGSGSTYRLNGRELRARDVATMFADLGSGARSAGIISQSRVSALIEARPEDRRGILEEAAGVAGLHARRHEAELKLRAAEQNLARAEELRRESEIRLEALRKQARQAARYRTLSGAIRDAELESTAIERALAQANRAKAHEAVRQARDEDAELRERARESAAVAEAAQAALVPLRTREAEQRTELERARIGAEQAEASMRAAAAAQAEMCQRITQIERDLEHAQRIGQDADAAIQRLRSEIEALDQRLFDAPAAIAQSEAALAAALPALADAESTVETAAANVAGQKAAADAAHLAFNAARERASRAAGRAREAVRAHEQALATLIPLEQLQAARDRADTAKAAREAADMALDAARQRAEASETARESASRQFDAARRAATEAEATLSRLTAERDGLVAMLAQKFGRDSAPVLDQINVADGLETALGAAFLAELSAGLDPQAPRYWRALPPHPPREGGLERLTLYVSAPPALARAFDHILLLPEGGDGEALQDTLRPGEILVGRDGALWRWDGYTMRAGAPSDVATRLAQRNRLAKLKRDHAECAQAAETAKAACEAASLQERIARDEDVAARTARREAEQRADRARNDAATKLAEANRIEAETERLAARVTPLSENRERFSQENAEAEAALQAAQAALNATGASEPLRAALDQARAAANAARAAEQSARSELARAREEAERAKLRHTQLANEAPQWAERARDAATRMVDLQARLREAVRQRDHLALTQPGETTRENAEASLREARAAHAQTASTLATAERAARDQQAQAAAAAAAEAAGAERLNAASARATEADYAWGSLEERIIGRLGAHPALPVMIDPSPESAERARRRFERLTREREDMGPVNLRAEQDALEIETEIDRIDRERREIAEAIAKLRGSIGHLNREGRERLRDKFVEIDRHFQALFQRMFGGGRAHLALVGSEDPLEAGLEIFAEPPGKRPAILSLLSGGEQALTALSLIFAAFRCNPAPVAVLDEVDAPLDDANVERFCLLLRDVERETGTRFLVVTHHHLTMARMDRLYGVTMQERGISRLLSVDLTAAITLADAPRASIAAE